MGASVSSLSGSVISPGSLLAYLEGADFERAVFAPGQRVEVSVTARLFSGATRRAIELRDRTCTHPFCDVPAERCQIDHIVPYALGGQTTQENGRVLCGFHNRLRNQRPPPHGTDRQTPTPTPTPTRVRPTRGGRAPRGTRGPRPVARAAVPNGSGRKADPSGFRRRWRLPPPRNPGGG